MKQLLKFFNLLLCLELIMAPVMPHMSLLVHRAHAEEAVCGAGFYMDTVTNTCKINAQAANTINAASRCASGDKNCYENNAKDGLNKSVNEGKAPELKENQEGLTTTLTSISTAAPLVFALLGILNKKTKIKCKSLSMWALIAGSLSFIAGDAAANLEFRSKLKDIKEDWGKIVNPEEAGGDKDKQREASVKAQTESFEMLARAEDAFKESAETKETLYYAASAAYAVSAAIAVAEMIKAKALRAASDNADQAVLSHVGLPSWPGMVAFAAITKAKETKYNLENNCSETGVASLVNDQTGVILYSEYSKPNPFNWTHALQASINLEKSQDLVSFMLNLKEFNNETISPIQDYEFYQSAFIKLKSNESNILKSFKKITLAMIHHMNPLQNAYSKDKLDSLPEDLVDNSGSSSGPSAGTTAPKKAQVDTYAAKQFKAAKDYEPKGVDWLGIGIGVGVGAVASAAIGPKIVNSTSRLAFATVMSGMSAYMGSYAGKQAKASSLRANRLREMKQDFTAGAIAVNSCKSTDRNDPSKPNCYCYTADNKRNPSRNNSSICQNLWAGVNLKPGTYSTNPASKVKSCIDAQGASDTTCKCKASNTCLKVSVNKVKGLGTNTLSMLSKGVEPINKLADGTASAADLDATGMANLAAKTSKLANEMAKDKSIADLVKDKDKAVLELTKDLQAASSSLANSLPSTKGSTFSMPGNAGEAALMLNKDIEKSEEEPRSLGGSDTVAGPNGSVNEVLDFGLNQDNLNAGDEGQLAEVMKEDFDYGSNDVNQGANGSIFEVISNRYQRSAMKRLFDEEAQTQPNQPPKK